MGLRVAPVFPPVGQASGSPPPPPPGWLGSRSPSPASAAVAAGDCVAATPPGLVFNSFLPCCSALIGMLLDQRYVEAGPHRRFSGTSVET